MDNYIKEQENLYLLLAKTITNFKKSPKQRLTKGYVQVRMETLVAHWTNFHHNHLEMLKLVPTKDRGQFEYFTKDVYQEVEEQYIDLRSDMLDMLSNMSVRGSETNRPSVNNPSTAPNICDEVKLPKINIPKYSGLYHEWTSFQDMYISLIHNKTTISKVQKIHYLKGCLFGEAEQLLKHVPVTEDNYDLAWKILTDRYNNKRIIVNTILSRLVNQRKLTTGTSKGLRELLDTTTECLNKLKNQDIQVDTWDVLVIHLIVNKLDSESHKEWEHELGSLDVCELPKLSMLTKFLEKRFRVLEMIQAPSPSAPVKQRSFHINKSEQKCIFCNQDHLLYTCKEFAKLAVEKRVEYVQGWRLCFNCLIPGHSVKFCKHRSSCRRCGRKHHSLLHSTPSPSPQPTATAPEPSAPRLEDKEDIQEEKEDKNKRSIISHLTMGNHAVMMPTALVQVNTEYGEKHLMRALLDPCSQESFITEAAAQRLRLQRTSISGHVTGVGQMKTSLKHAAEIQFSSRIEPEMKMKVTAYVVRHITDIMPANKVEIEDWTHLEKLCLADPTCHTPGHIDLLLGVEVCSEVLKPGVIKGPSGTPIAQDTQLGWIISGNARTEHTANKNIVSMHLNVDLNSMLRKFWELETIEEEYNNTLTSDEKRAEDIYHNTHTRKEDGRYVVKLPFREETPVLPSDSRAIAIKRWQSLERRLDKTPQLKEDYNQVLQEYIDLKHMEKVDIKEIPEKCVYLPHHAVVREGKETTRVRVVFNASCAGLNGVTLNDALLIGPTLQEDLRDILLRWRTHQVAYVADIVKMYRQIEVNETDTDYQRIVWRTDPKMPIEDYRLRTVTFGTACAPYLAIKTLRQVALDEGREHPEAQRIILEDFYMDDVLSGHETEDGAKRNQNELTEILTRGGFELQKWSSNSESFMNEINPVKRSQNTQRDVDGRDSIKTLGIKWNTGEDTLQVTNNLKKLPEQPITKRNVLADIASLFDPMGWLAPSIVMAKIFMQKLWTLGIGWDEELTDEMKQEWLKFRNEIPAVTEVQINRWIHTTADRSSIQVHGFADASMSAYAAVIYVRAMNTEGQIKVSLLTAKTKAAPLKQISVPRLELCGAVLLCRLLKYVVKILKLQKHQVFAWSDSKTVLAWIRGDPGRWTPFVKNRVAEIKMNDDINGWYYINTKHNPADPASRGIMPRKLLSNTLWWSGPAFLAESVIELPENDEVPETELECRKVIKSLVTEAKANEEDFILTLMRRYSSLGKLVRIIAYCRRWIVNLKRKKINKAHLPTYLTTEERNDALTICLRRSQEIEFPEEIDDLKSKRQLKRKSRLLSLTPFLDAKGVLRVGGRLRHADLGAEQKHPIILTKDNALLPLLLAEAHSSTLHGGQQLMTMYLRSKYWLINAGNKIKKYVRDCIVCIRQRGETSNQLMGDLPAIRVKPNKPFLISGVDFAGPINVRMSKGRGAKSTKAYISLFVCMVTRAFHIELVSSLTTQAFLAALKRFVARRGRCSEMWSDHGTNFVGAQKELLAMWRQGQAKIPDEFAAQIEDMCIKWKYIPPAAPNFGGLWEAGVKSIKYHMKRVVGNSTLTFEEMTTLLTQIEACLNSRPLYPLNDDPDSLQTLTPGHFLTGEQLISIPDEDYTDFKIHQLSRWQLTQKMLQDFWKKWQSEYLTRLQQRPKWNSITEDLDIGDLVLVKDQRLPPGHWPMGRIVGRRPGPDGLTRAYEIRTASGVMQRPITKLCILPLSKDSVLSGGVCSS